MNALPGKGGRKTAQLSEKNDGRSPLAGSWCGQAIAAGGRHRFRPRRRDGRRQQENHPGESGAQTVAGDALLAGVGGQRILVPQAVADGMGPRRQLGEEEGENEEEVANGMHRL